MHHDLTNKVCGYTPRLPDSDSDICSDHGVQNPPDISPQSPCM